MIAEGRTGGGFLRGALWADAASPEEAGDYARLAGLLGFEKEFAVAPNQTVGVEAVIGGGHTWGAPEYAPFTVETPIAIFFTTVWIPPHQPRSRQVHGFVVSVRDRRWPCAREIRAPHPTGTST